MSINFCLFKFENVKKPGFKSNFLLAIKISSLLITSISSFPFFLIYQLDEDLSMIFCLLLNHFLNFLSFTSCFSWRKHCFFQFFCQSISLICFSSSKVFLAPPFQYLTLIIQFFWFLLQSKQFPGYWMLSHSSLYSFTVIV